MSKIYIPNIGIITIEERRDKIPEYKNYVWAMIGVFALICLILLWLFHLMGVLDDICVLWIVLPPSSLLVYQGTWLRSI